MQTQRKIFILLWALMTANLAWADDYTAEIDYVVLDKPVKTITGNQVEVRELFWYACPHCFNAEPLVKAWLQNIPDTAQFVRQPAVFSKRWVNGAVFYYVLEQLGEVDRLHGKLFDAIHVHNAVLEDQDDFVDWLAENGVEAAKAEKAVKSFSVRTKVNKSKRNTAQYHIKGVPAFVVNGKYWVDSSTAGSQARIFKIINYLIKQESQTQ